jgi:uncharacterized protein YqeY
MSLQERVMTEMKSAMRAKDALKLEALRAIKSELLLAQSASSSKEGLTEEGEAKLLQKLVKQRRDSAVIYKEQGRQDLAEPEVAQATVISMFLPEQLNEAEIEEKVEEVINRIGAEGMKDMGKVMTVVSTELAGKADGKTISMVVKRKLS